MPNEAWADRVQAGGPGLLHRRCQLGAQDSEGNFDARTGRHGWQERIALEAVYRATADVAPGWTTPGCKVEIEGRPRLVLDLGEGWISNALVATAMHAVHAVPHVCRVEPGIRTFLDLPLIAGRHAFRGAHGVDDG